MRITKTAILVILLILFLIARSSHDANAFAYAYRSHGIKIGGRSSLTQRHLRRPESQQEKIEDKKVLNFYGFWRFYPESAGEYRKIPVDTVIAPEPFSSAIFLLGGGMMVMLRRRKSR